VKLKTDFIKARATTPAIGAGGLMDLGWI